MSLTETSADLCSDIHLLDDKAVINRIYVKGKLLSTVNVKFSNKLAFVQTSAEKRLLLIHSQQTLVGYFEITSIYLSIFFPIFLPLCEKHVLK